MNKETVKMVNGVFSFNLLYGIDSLIEVLLVVTAFAIFYKSYVIWKTIRDKRYLLFSAAFFILGASYIFQILANLVVYHQVVQSGNLIFLVTSAIPYAGLFKVIFHFVYELLSLMAFLTLFLITTGTESKARVFLFIYFGFIVAFFSIYFPFAHHLTLFVILFFLAGFFYKNYLKVKSRNSLLVFISFSILFVSNLILTFTGLHYLVYLIGGFLTVAAYLILLVNQINMKNEQKKNKTGSSKRHFGSSKRE